MYTSHDKISMYICIQKFNALKHSLVPRPSHCPVFDWLQYARMGGGRHGPLYHMNDVSVYRGGEGSLIERAHFMHMFFILNQERYIFCMYPNTSARDRNHKKRPQACSFNRSPPYLGRHWCHSHEPGLSPLFLHIASIDNIPSPGLETMPIIMCSHVSSVYWKRYGFGAIIWNACITS